MPRALTKFKIQSTNLHYNFKFNYHGQDQSKEARGQKVDKKAKGQGQKTRKRWK